MVFFAEDSQLHSCGHRLHAATKQNTHKIHGFEALKWNESVANYLHITRKDNEKGTMNALF